MKKKIFWGLIIVIVLISIAFLFSNNSSKCALPENQITIQKIDESIYYFQIQDCAKLKEVDESVSVTIGVNVYVNDRGELYFINNQNYSEDLMNYNDLNQEMLCYDKDVKYSGDSNVEVKLDNINSLFRIDENELVGLVSFSVQCYENTNSVNYFDIFSVLEHRNGFEWKHYNTSAEYHIGYEFVNDSLQLTFNRKYDK